MEAEIAAAPRPAPDTSPNATAPVPEVAAEAKAIAPEIPAKEGVAAPAAEEAELATAKAAAAEDESGAPTAEPTSPTQRRATASRIELASRVEEGTARQHASKSKLDTMAEELNALEAQFAQRASAALQPSEPVTALATLTTAAVSLARSPARSAARAAATSSSALSPMLSPTQVRAKLASRVVDGTARGRAAKENLVSMADRLAAMEASFASRVAALRALQSSSSHIVEEIAAAAAAPRPVAAEVDSAASSALALDAATAGAAAAEAAFATRSGPRVTAKATISGITREEFEDPTNPVRLAFLAAIGQETGGSPVKITRVSAIVAP